ncbi:predicted protein [Sclerotinia sclerotiorum 1980 UF-70]|uniref:Uncharacterized protein n=1 Tax=Sclerotinia sclerotiorum (strain ATCC 18683 / 1980 / Ss-1) TaxID=665079 RepID=A7F240_SCLS1|nr:predicted protein [Sclerotinia sclerotiorum 1980 UF-70]EDN95782.1 predicted protein [Sclerotinia sclerotiorum 1980 UF-70]
MSIPILQSKESRPVGTIKEQTAPHASSTCNKPLSRNASRSSIEQKSETRRIVCDFP